MTYTRVCPRDLFNEGNLLRCLGQLFLKTEGMDGVGWHDPQPGEAFHIDQDESDGSISCATATLMLGEDRCHFHRPLNARDPYPLLCTHVGATELWDEVAVFDEAGELTTEFMSVIAGQR